MRLRDRLAKYDTNGDPLHESFVLTEWERAKDAGLRRRLRGPRDADAGAGRAGCAAPARCGVSGEAAEIGLAQSWSRGDWMQLFSGRRFFPMDPRPEEIEPVDIAHALSLICRYGGHAQRFYSVAEHCVLLSRWVAPEHALWALLHDASEAYVGDMVRPLKRQLPDYEAAEGRVIEAVAARFGLTCPMPPEVKDADNRILLDERAAILGPVEYPWAVEHLEPLGVRVSGWSPPVAEDRYLERLMELAGDMWFPPTEATP